MQDASWPKYPSAHADQIAGFVEAEGTVKNPLEGTDVERKFVEG